jgi:GNAT superfamily N-acetyltransferase
MEICELSADDVRAAAEELGRLLLDAHASGMALGLAGPLTPERARDVWVETAVKLDARRRVLLVAREDGAVVGTVQIVRAESENGQHRAEIQRLAVRADRRGAGIGRALLAAAVDRSRRMGLRLLWLTTHEDTASDRFYASAGWTRAGAMPLYSARPDGALAGGAFYYLVL